MKILFVDDSKAVHSYLKECFYGLGYELTHAMDGQEAVELLIGDNKSLFDLVFLDWEMPILTGPEVLEKVIPAGLKIPVILLTSKNSITNITSMLEKGAADYVMKPFTKELLLEKIAPFVESQVA